MNKYSRIASLMALVGLVLIRFSRNWAGAIGRWSIWSARSMIPQHDFSFLPRRGWSETCIMYKYDIHDMAFGTDDRGRVRKKERSTPCVCRIVMLCLASFKFYCGALKLNL